MSLVLWSLALTITLLALHTAVRGITSLRLVKIIFLPGVLAAIASRLLACGLARAPVKAVHPPWIDGEPLEHEPSTVPVFGRLLIAFLPFAMATVGIIALRSILSPALVLAEVTLPPLEATGHALGTFIEGTVDMARNARVLAGDEELHDPLVAVFLYLSLSLLVFTAPTLEDWIPLGASFAAAAVFMAALDYLGLRAGFLTRGWYIKSYYGPVAFECLVLLLTLSLLALAAMTVGTLGAWILGKARGEPASSGTKSRRRGRARKPD